MRGRVLGLVAFALAVQSNSPSLGGVNSFWTGSQGTSWNIPPGFSNFVDAFTGGQAAVQPLATTNVFFTASSASNLATTLDRNYTLNSLSFTGTGSPASSTPVSIGGANTLTLQAAVSFTDQNNLTHAAGTGLVVQSGAAAPYISALVALGGPQAWEIDNSPTAPLTVVGQISGSGGLTKTGTGELVLANSTNSFGGLTVANGTVLLNTVGAAGPAGDVITLSGAAAGGATLLAGFTTVGNALQLTAGAVQPLTLGNKPGAVAVFAGNLALNGNDLALASTGTGATTLAGAISGSGNLLINNDAGASTELDGASPGFTGNVSVSAGTLRVAPAVASNTLSALGSGTLKLGGGLLSVKASGTASNQVITSATDVAVTGNASINLANTGANTANAVAFRNLSIGASTLSLTSANGYLANFTGTTTITGAATLSASATDLNLLGHVEAGGNPVTVTGGGSVRLVNTAGGAAADSITGTLSVTGGVLQGYATAAGVAVAGSNSLGTATIALGGANPVLRLTPSLDGGLSVDPVAGLHEKGFTATFIANFLGATQIVIAASGAASYLNTPAGGQQVAVIDAGEDSTPTATFFQFNGLLKISTGGMYGFTTRAPGGTLFIDGNAPITTGTFGVPASGNFYLTPGLHVFSERIASTGSGALTVSYQGPDTGNSLLVVNSGTGAAANVFSTATASQLAANFGNNVTVASGTAATIDIAADTKIGSVTFAGTGATLNVTGSGDVNTLTTGKLTLAGNSTLAPGTAVLVVPQIAGTATAGSTAILGLAGTAAANTYSAGNTVAGSISDGLGGGQVALVKSGLSIWTLSGTLANTYTGGTVVQGSGATGTTTVPPLILAKPAGTNAIPAGTLTIGGGGGYAFVKLGASEQIDDSVIITFNAQSGSNGFFDLLGFNESVAGLVENTNTGTVENAFTEVPVADSTLTLRGSGTYSFAGGMQDHAGGFGTERLNLVLAGSGTQVLSGFRIIYTGTTTIASGVLALNAATAFTSVVTFASGSSGVLQINSSSSAGGLSSIDATNNLAFVQNNAGADAILTLNQSLDTTFGGILRNHLTSNTLGLNKNGTGTLTLTNTNSYTGGTTVTAGTLRVGGAGTLGAATSPLAISGGTLDLNGTTQTTGALSGSGGTLLNNGTGAASLTVAGGSYSGTIRDHASGTGTVALGSTGQLTLGGTNSYTGGTTVNGPAAANPWLQLTNPAGAGTGPIGLATGNGLLLAAGTVTVGNAIGGAGYVENYSTSASTVTLAGALSYTGPTLFRVAGSAINFAPSSDSTLAGNIGSAGMGFGGTSISGGSVIKSGGSTLTLTGNGSYTGATTVSGGTLALAGGGSLGNTAITVAPGATFAVLPGSGSLALGTTGSGSAGGTLAISAGGVFSMVDGAAGSSQLNQNASFSGTPLSLTSATLSLELGASGADVLNVSGGTGSSSISGTNTINLTALGSSLTPGTYPLIRANGIAAGNRLFKFGNGANAETLSAGGTPYFLTLSGIAGQEQVTVATPARLSWTGQTSGTGPSDSAWSTTAGHLNLASGTAPANHMEGAVVSFQDLNSVTGGSVTNGAVIVQAAGVSPAGVNVDNMAVDYSFGNAAGTTGLTGSTSLIKSGAGRLTLLGANTYTGDTGINGGTVTAGVAEGSGNGPFGNGGAIAFGGGTLQYSAANSADYSSRFSTAVGQVIQVDTNSQNVTWATGLTSFGGSLRKLGAGTLTLSAGPGASTYTGATTIDGGTLKLSSSAASTAAGILAGTPSIVVNSGATLLLQSTVNDLLGTTAGLEAVTINGGSVLNNGTNSRITLANVLTMTGGLLGGTSAPSQGAFSFSTADQAVAINATSDAQGAPAVIGGSISFQAAQTYLINVPAGAGTPAPASDLTINGSLVSYFFAPTQVRKTGTGILTYAGSNSSNIAAFGITGGTIVIGADNALGSIADFTFGDFSIPGTGTLQLNGFNQQFHQMSVFSNTATANVVNIGAGKTLTLISGLSVELFGAVATTTSLTVAGAGRLNISGGNLQVGLGQNSTGILDLSGLTGSFSANVTRFDFGPGNAAPGVIKLASGANSVTATSITVTATAATNAPGTSTLLLGSGLNTLSADSISIGLGQATGSIAFASQAPGSPGSVTITNKAGTGGASLSIGDGVGNFTATAATGTLDLRGHLSSVTAGTVALGVAGSAVSGGGRGTLWFDSGAFTVSSLSLGAKSSSLTAVAAGSLSIGGGTFTVNAGGSFVLATNSAATGSATGSIDLTGGTLISNVDLSKGGGTLTTATLTLEGGGFDLTGHNLGSAAVPIDNLNFFSGTLMNVGKINGAAGLTKTTPGTLILAGANTYTGLTNIAGGTLELHGSISGSVNVANGANLDVTNIAGGFSVAGATSLSTSGASGTATVTGALKVSGALVPGGTGSLGTLKVTQSLTLNATGVLQAEIAGAQQNDLVTTGTLTIDPAATLSLAVLNGYQPGPSGSLFFLVETSEAESGAFGNAVTRMTLGGAYGAGSYDVLNATYNGQQYAISYTGDHTQNAFAVTGGHDVVLMAVPEPGTCANLSVALAALAGFRRIRRRSPSPPLS